MGMTAAAGAGCRPGLGPPCDRVGHAWGITAAAERGDRDALDRELAAYAALADELRQPRYRWYARSRQAMRAIMTGDFPGGERMAADGRDIADRVGEPDAENLLVAVLSRSGSSGQA